MVDQKTGTRSLLSQQITERFRLFFRADLGENEKSDFSTAKKGAGYHVSTAGKAIRRPRGKPPPPLVQRCAGIQKLLATVKSYSSVSYRRPEAQRGDSTKKWILGCGPSLEVHKKWIAVPKMSQKTHSPTTASGNPKSEDFKRAF